MFCTNCGKEIDDNMQFCTYCGHRFDSQREAANKKKINPVLVTVLVLTIAVIVFVVAFLVIHISGRENGNTQSDLAENRIKENTDREETSLAEKVEQMDTDNAEAVESAGEVEVSSAEAISEKMTPEVREELFEEVFAVIPYYWGSMDVDTYLAETLMDNAYFFLNGEIDYLPIALESGEASTPVDLDFEGIRASEMASYFRCKSDELERLIEDIYGSALRLPLGEVNYAACQNDGQYLTEWGFSWHVSYEGWHMERGQMTFDLKDDELTISFPYTAYNVDDDSDWSCETKWIANPDSFLGFTMTSIRNTRQKRDLSYLTAEDIEAERLRIRDLIAAGGTEVIREEAGSDGLPWKKEYYYENGNLVFAFFYDATDGTEDYRFYFMDGVMIRWMTGTSPNQIQYNLSDSVLPDEWSTWETTILELSE